MAEIDKATAAERMIVAAITMSERGEDPLAIHVVSASALNLLRDLIDKVGDDYVEQVLKVGAFAIATARRNDEPLILPTNAAIDAVIEHVIAGIEAGEVKRASDLVVTVSPAERRAMLSYIVKPYNFLKHADRDPLATLDDSDINPDDAIGHALTAFTFVCPDKPLPDSIKPYLERRGFA